MEKSIEGSIDSTSSGDAEARPRQARLDTVPSADFLTTIVLGHDRQMQSQDALDVAIDLAERLRAHLHVVHAIDLDDAPIEPELLDWEEQTRQMLARERAAVAASLSAHSAGWSYHVGHGDPAQLLARVADAHDALMIIIGSRGEGLRASFGRLLTAPVSHRLIQHAKQPVLVVSHPVEPLDA
jgi:nucleotide-binding universal stress UspA family protein